MRLSVLDQSTVVSGRSPDTSIRESLELAVYCEQLGYERYWVAEHHNSASQAGTAPEILIAAIAATTHRMRVGSAGVMLPHYASLKVAEQFRVLEAIAPGRIDIGLGRAPGSDGRTAYALNPNAATASDNFPAQVRDLLDWLAGRPLAEGHPFRDVIAQPGGPTVPEAWILGSSDYGGQVAAYFGLPFCFAHFITDGRGAKEAIDLYREQFRPSERLKTPYAAVCVWAMAAESQAEAERLFTSRAAWRLGRDRGVYAALPTPEEIAGRIFSPSDETQMAHMRQTALYGTPANLGRRLRSLAASLAVDEIAVLTTVADPRARQLSYQLLAEEFGLRPERVGRIRDVACAAE